LAVESKGKNGGIRVISYLETEIIGMMEEDKEIINVNLIAIYDKDWGVLYCYRQ